MTIKKKIAVGVAGLAALASAGTAAVWALPDEAFEITYYSDASKTVVVGGLDYMCGHRGYRWGERTPYSTKISYGPC